nr:hypothetical protein [Kibdelosporangium sp. MJ126-NF4]
MFTPARHLGRGPARALHRPHPSALARSIQLAGRGNLTGFEQQRTHARNCQVG